MSAIAAMQDPKLSPTQKAAAILIAVGPEAASTVLGHMTEAEVETLALEVATLGQLAPGALDGVMRQFRDEAVAHQHLLVGGEDHARAMLRSWRGDKGDEIIDRLLATVQTAPFHFLRQHEPAALVQHVCDEHPQTIALILAHLPAKFSAQVLAGLAPEVQGEVAVRVATMDSTSPEVVTRVEAALRTRLGVVTRSTRDDRGGGVKDLADMLNNSDRGTERAILGVLELDNPELAEQVRALMFIFEDITTLDDRAIQEVLRNVEARQLALALKGVRSDVREVVMRNLSERAALSLSEEQDLLGPTRVADVEAAQTEVVRHIRRLEEAGTIVISRTGGDFVD